ncbi:hypothetical protein [Kordiimonas sp.]|uniref:hypothetical protein n=1 Tax=Kordiimonas sp. TaxID=1970157 RepID=UPI003A8D1263
MIDDKFTPLVDRLGEVVIGSVLGTLGGPSDEEAEVEEARQKCRAGNPFPLIALQWPFLIIDDPETAKFFDGEIGSKDNPCLRLDWWQRLAIQGFFDPTVSEIFFKGATGTGKGFTSSLIACLAFDVHRECKIHVTSVRLDHVRSFLFAEIRKNFDLMKYPAGASVSTTHIQQTNTRYISILQPDKNGNGESFSGAHSDFTVFFFDESSGVPSHFYNNCLNNCRKVVCLSNPRTKQGFFYDAYAALEPKHGHRNATDVVPGRNGRRLLMTIGGMDCANTKYRRLRSPVGPKGGIEIDGQFFDHGEPLPDEIFKQVSPLIPNQIDLGRYLAISSGDGVDHPLLIPCFADGIFPEEDPEFQAIFSAWVQAHTVAAGAAIAVDSFGLDVARSLNGDSSVLTPGSRFGSPRQHEFKFSTYPEIANEVLRIAKDDYAIDLKQGVNPVCIDYTGGYGAGVGDWLRRCNVWVIEFCASGRAVSLPHVYINRRAEVYCLLGERLKPGGVFGGKRFAIPDDPELREELTTPLKIPDKQVVRWQLQSKDEIKKIIKRSPDKGDSFTCMFAAVCELAQWNSIFAQMRSLDGAVLTDSQQDALKELHPIDRAFGNHEPQVIEGPQQPEQAKHPLDVEVDFDSYIEGLMSSAATPPRSEYEGSDEEWLVDR